MASALPQGTSTRPPNCNPTELWLALASGAYALPAVSLRAAVRLRGAQEEARLGARGAFLKVSAGSGLPFVNVAEIACSPLLSDFHSLIVMQLSGDLPSRAAEFSALLEARRGGFEPSAFSRELLAGNDESARSVCDASGISFELTSATVTAALKPLCEAVAAALLGQLDLPTGGAACPICGGLPWAECGRYRRCGRCETQWTVEGNESKPSVGEEIARGVEIVDRSRRPYPLWRLDEELFETAFEPTGLFALVR